jgi:hypothetical protein
MKEYPTGNIGNLPPQSSLAQKAELLARSSANKDAVERQRAA